MNVSKKQTMIVYKNGERVSSESALIVEEPLSIRIEGQPYAVVMRTPGDEIAHVAGFCLSEGLIGTPKHLGTIGFCSEAGTNVATVTLTGEQKKKVAALLERKGFVSQTSCGICGKELVEDLHQITTPVETTLRLTVEEALQCAARLPDCQPVHKQTRSAHAAMIFDKNSELLASAEDVGRHNALDKAIGKILMEGRINTAAFGVMSSRLSYELVQKAARAGLELMIGVSRPTSLAVELARSVNMTLACARDSELMVFCGEERLTLR
ncbi:MAG: formate dehydrogenase accessory sulfurtransferase FdhD [Desulfosalsimonadaceae bacterium]|nr:formate dehydrogenase accessory sulfurtransferase FdhD [Desulfosalsimonadaceae bacterium]